MSERLFLKLGGSLLTDKRGDEALRPQVLARLAREIRGALSERPELQLVVGHGSGSFGHVAAAPYQTRAGVTTERQWRGFAGVSAAAARLNRIVCDAFLDAGIPAVSLQPSASAHCLDGKLIHLATRPVGLALAAGLVPVVYGDVAFDVVRGGTIISTEEILAHLTEEMQPGWLLLAGDTDGVYGPDGAVIPKIDEAGYARIEAAVGGSGGTDVTGGMAGKVQAMLALVGAHPGLRVRIFSGLKEGRLQENLLRPEEGAGTLIVA